MSTYLLPKKIENESLSTNQLLNYGLIVLVIILLVALIYSRYRYKTNLKLFREGSEKGLFTTSQTVLNKEKNNEISAKLSALEAENFYLDSKMSIRKLANKLDTNVKYISTYLNQTLGCNYTSYINRLRIDWLQRKLNTDAEFREKYNLDGMAKQCGFASYFALNTACKRMLNKTASEVIKEVTQDDS